jgi:hypothetical protein
VSILNTFSPFLYPLHQSYDTGLKDSRWIHIRTIK